MSADTCYRLDSVEYGPLPKSYPLQVGSVAKFPKGKPPEATFNNETNDWVAMHWVEVPDPRIEAEARDRLRFQAENWDRVRVATESEKDEVLRWLNDNEPDMLRLAMDEADR